MESLVKKEILEKTYASKKVFVPGHTAFKGSWLIIWLNMLGAAVKGYALQPENEKDIYNIVSPHLNIENVFADIRDRKRLQQEIISFKPDFIFHLEVQSLMRRS